MTAVEVFAPAKINLTLHVTGQLPCGYHTLDSLVVFADIGDTIRATPADRLGLTIDGPQAAGLAEVDADNLVTRAARIAPGGPGVALHLTKRLPPASGIGGGSSDAAATLLALARLHGTPLPAPEALMALGADLPVCLLRRPCRMQGRGETLTALPDLPPLDIVLVNPGVSVPTPAVFAALADRQNPGMGPLPRWTSAEDLADWLKTRRNDLYKPARSLVPEIDKTLNALRNTAPLFAAMSGSGATCFGLYPPGHAPAAHATLSQTHPHWWSAAGRLGSFPV